MKISKIQKRILAFLLIITLLFTSVSMQYKTASADAFAWAATSFAEFAEVASLSLPWGTLVVVLVGLAGGCIAYEYGDDIQATGEKIWSDFEHYYVDEWIRVTKNNIKDVNDIKDDSLRALDEWVEYALQGCVSISSDIWHAFKEFINTQYGESSTSFVNPDLAVIYDNMLNGGVVAEVGMELLGNNIFYDNDIFPISSYSISSITCEKEVSLGFLNYQTAPTSAKYVFRQYTYAYAWSVAPFTIMINFDGNFTYDECICSKLDTATGLYFMELCGHVMDVTEEMIHDCYTDFRFPSEVFFPSLEELIAAVVATDIPIDWNNVNRWERSDDFDHTADYEDVIVLNPPGINDHAESNKTLEEQVEEAIELALTNAATWDLAMEILNVMPLDEACENLLENGTPSSEEKENEKEKENSNKNDVPSADTPSSSSTPYTFSGLEKLFPFCIPFDIYNFINLLDAEPVPPSFKWKFIVYKKKYEISIDLKEWNSVAEILRNMELICFCVGLALITRSRMIKS